VPAESTVEFVHKLRFGELNSISTQTGTTARAYMKDAKAEMKAAGFRSTPWDSAQA
jgi:hypothetical protein